ncbi:PREDICTED: uncharacterized protein LOC108560780 [Nicrophorus vespilloides]|uniref:Bestrophin homolog n=1 Tax=Nicrophorus vespilloides TaxID=110193 RepID=A0ABM1MHA0_NICVS|nr:PREDICTED: uncharacterized protein LOC108560780 [Nicrophorus vespilloides]
MLENERVIFERMDAKTPMSKYWMPLVWATNIINRARKESLITSDQIVQTLLTELSVIRQKLGSLIGYDTVCVPLVYTQVVTLALYTYFIAALMGRQFIPDAPQPVGKFEDPDMYFPFFTALQFCFYVGWLKVAEVLINPFGEDDDDIELNWLIDRHIKASYMIVDEMHEEHPELLKDQFWDDVVPTDLPYTVASEHCRREEPKGSAEKYKVKTADALYANLQVPSRKIIIDDMYADYESVDTPIVQRRKSPSWINRISISRPRGSVRSASTAYSSGGLFSRHRGNSVYAETAGQLPHQQQPKMSIYDRLVRRSGRNKNHTKTVKSRPRIPTPDVTKEVVDRENRLAQNAVHMQNQISPNVTLMAHQLQGACPNDVPMVQVVLSPIQELDGSGSVNNTLHAGQPGTAALAQAVLSPGLGPVLTKPITVSQLTSLGLAKVTSSPLLTKAVAINSSPLFARAVADTSQPSTLIEYTPEGLVKVTKSPLLQGADSLHDSPSSGKALTDDGYTSDGLTKVTNSPLFTGVDQSCMLAEYTSDDEMKQNISSRSSNASNHTNASNDTKEATDTTASLTSNGIGIESERKISMNTPSTLSSPHLEFLSSPSDNASRKTSVASQSSSPKREVYV